jgi:hypothetical protein
MLHEQAAAIAAESLPSLGAWIETQYLADEATYRKVAPCIGSVD